MNSRHTSPFRLVGLVGATGSGKTTLAQRIVEHHGFVRFHIGQPIKDMLAAMGVPPNALTGPPEARSAPQPLLGGRSARYAMETLGTDWGRRLISPDIWSSAVCLRLLDHFESGHMPVIVDDVRFPNDWMMIHKLGGLLVKVTRPGYAPTRSPLDHMASRSSSVRKLLVRLGAPVVHETEYHWHDAPADFSLENDGTPDDLLDAFTAGLYECGSDR